MGWTSHQRYKGISNRDWFADLLDSPHGRVQDTATVAGTCYIAYRVEGPGEEPYTTALIVLTRWSPHDYYNFSYKIIDEEMGPAENRCPERILEQLSPPEQISQESYAQEQMNLWRSSCQNYHAKRKSRGSISRGNQILFRHPIRFSDGTKAERFEWKHGNTFYLMGFQDGVWNRTATVRIRDWRDREWAKLS